MTKREKVERRVIEVAKYTILNKHDIRTTAKAFGVSKSTIHKDLIERLPQYSQDLYQKVRIILDFHLDIRAIRGGIATKNKFKGLYNGN